MGGAGGSFQVGGGAAPTEAEEEADLRHQLQSAAPHAFGQGRGAIVGPFNQARPRGPTLVSSH